MTYSITTDNDLFKATIKKSGMDGEFVVTFYEREEADHLWTKIPDAEYYTDDKDDAVETATLELENLLAL